MGKLRPAESRLQADRRSFHSLAVGLLRHSLLLYILAVVLHRLWVLLNSDVLLLIRRVH